MSGFKNFAVLGAGNLGKYIIEELLRAKAAGTVSAVSVISRSEIDNSAWKVQGAKFAVVDYDSAASLASAFVDVDVVISTVGGPALTKQVDIAKAAKAASVKLFVPSEFGGDNRDATEGVFLVKKKVQDQIKELGLPYALFVNGPFSDWVFIPPLGFNFAEGKVHIGGSGNTPISFTARPDIARYLTHVLTNLPASELNWRSFFIEGDRISLNDIVSGYQKKTGKKLEVTYTTQEDLKAAIAKNPDDFFTFLKLIWDQGLSTVGDKNDNGLFPEWNPKKVSEVLA